MDEDLAFISYLDDNNAVVSGYFKIIHFDSNMVKFKSHNNIVTIPTARILKVKEKFIDEGDK